MVETGNGVPYINGPASSPCTSIGVRLEGNSCGISSRILGWKHLFVVNLYQKCFGARLISEKLLLIIAEMHHSQRAYSIGVIRHCF